MSLVTIEQVEKHPTSIAVSWKVKDSSGIVGFFVNQRASSQGWVHPIEIPAEARIHTFNCVPGVAYDFSIQPNYEAHPVYAHAEIEVPRPKLELEDGKLKWADVQDADAYRLAIITNLAEPGHVISKEDVKSGIALPPVEGREIGYKVQVSKPREGPWSEMLTVLW